VSEKVLFVDDEPKVLNGFRRQLFGELDIETAVGGAAGLEALASAGPFAVVVSDMRMPEMDGVQFLATVRRRAPESVRMMLTGCADQDTAIQAVNEGCIFRFLTKPCSPEDLVRALNAGIEQYRLIRAEKELLQNTLRGAIKVLSEVLALTNPTAFSHASRAQRLVRSLCEEMKIEKAWQLEIAAMLSQIGCVTVPPDILDKAYHGRSLKPAETQMLEAHPGIGGDLVRHIPRLDEIARIIAYQQKGFDGSGIPADDVAGEDIPLGARVLKVALDFETLKWGNKPGIDAIATLNERSAQYDPAVLEALMKAAGSDETFEIIEVSPKDLPLHAIIAEGVTTPEGFLIVGKGLEVTQSLRQRLMNFARKRDLHNQIRIRICVTRAPHEAATV
jgi:response regulator RpfG family c-di-GMP phosphodiesterase